MTRPAENPLAAEVEKLLAENGPMAKAMPEFVHSPEQSRLARAYAAGIGVKDPERNGKIGAIEAATGMGKTVAYLSVLMLNAARTDEKAMLSTRTRALQRQIVEQDGPAVREAVRLQTGEDVGPPQIRVGRGNYPDTDRMRRAAALLRRENPADPRADQMESIADLVDRKEDAATFDDLRQNYGISPPPEISPDIFRLTAASSEAASAHYNRHREQGRDAKIVVVNHALALMDARAAGGLFAADAERIVAIFDEADALPEQARSMSDEQIDLETLQLLAEAAPDDSAAELRQALNELTRAAANELKKGPAVIKPAATLPALAEKTAAAARAIKLPPLYSELRAELSAAAAVLMHWAKAARDGNPNFAATLVPSLVRSRPALSLCALSPAAVLARLWKAPEDRPPLFRAVVFTSATLSPSGETGDRYNPDHFLRAVAAPSGETNHDATRAFAPEEFGKMSFVLADREAPLPFLPKSGDDQAPQINPEFLQYAAEGIQAASKQGGRVLVLTSSFEVARALGEKIPQAILHRRGESAEAALEQYRKPENKSAILITPSAWEGVNLPGLVDHLVIPQIPFPPPDEGKIAALEEKFRAAGKSPESAKHILNAEKRHAAVRKLRQGIGRGLRRKSDRCKLWILDPRFPLPPNFVNAPRNRMHQGAAAKHANLAGAIPARFCFSRKSPFKRAELLRPGGNIRASLR